MKTPTRMQKNTSILPLEKTFFNAIKCEGKLYLLAVDLEGPNFAKKKETKFRILIKICYIYTQYFQLQCLISDDYVLV